MNILPGLLGNGQLKNTFGPAIREDRLAHAYILEGKEGSGKHTAARLIAAAAQCERRYDSEAIIPCCSCRSCSKILRNISVDVITISNRDKASIGVDNIREMIRTLYFTPNDGTLKFYFIENADLMTPQAQNSLLLSLEEPPEFIVFILLCSDSTKLLPTILSRAQLIRMERFNPDFVEEYLIKNNPKADRQKITDAAHLSGGSLGTAMTLLKNNAKELKYYETAEAAASVLVSASTSEKLTFTKNLPQKERQAAVRVLSLTRSAIRDIIAVKKGGDLTFYKSADKIPQSAKNVSVKKLLDVSSALLSAEDDIRANCSLNTVYYSLMLNTQKGR